MALRQDEESNQTSNQRERCIQLSLRISLAERLIERLSSEIRSDQAEFNGIGNERIRARIENGVVRVLPSPDDEALRHRKEELRRRMAQAERDKNEQSYALARAREEAKLIGCR
ncbi:hypothetical protein [Stappia sp. ES.058]|uniref:hypothetical protein n=1 Tax=Stappia sp. ES.058 TaxID=1881061 RepID=UPI00087CCC5D|nr:hypothetical protein [Stappia sp. ES.058]SDT88253.1 hypothetical protein SAMN05428979_0038 [Stappia sp. ES.058]